MNVTLASTRRDVVRSAWAFTLLLLALPLSSCEGNSPSTPTPPPPVTVLVVPSAATVRVGESTRLSAVVGNASSSAVSWQSSDPSVAMVDAVGNVRGVRVGSALVSASALSGNGAQSSAVVTVTAPPPPTCGEGIRTLPFPGSVSGVLATSDCVLADGRHHDLWSLTLGARTSLVIDLTSSSFDALLMVTDAGGNVLESDDDSGDGLNARIATTLPAGSYRVVATSFSTGQAGGYILSARSGGGAAASVQVSPSSASMTTGAVRSFQATVTGTSDTRVVWSSSAGGVATVDNAGIVRAVGPGVAILRATSVADPSTSGAATVTVTGGPAGTVEIVVTNVLLNAINISVNGVGVGSVPPGSTRQTQVPRTSSVALSWTLVRSTTSQGQPVGDILGGDFQPVTNPGDRINYTIDNVIGQSRIFRPIITNLTGTALLMGVNDGLQSQNRCNCVVPANSDGTQLGYYRLFSNSNVRAYRDGSGYTGGYIYWDSFTSAVEPGTGVLRLRASFPPTARLGAPAPHPIVPPLPSVTAPPPSDVQDVPRATQDLVEASPAGLLPALGRSPEPASTVLPPGGR